MQASAKNRFAPSCRRLSQGFTLVELMVVVAIIAIIAAIAVPQYNDSVKRGKAAEATNTLSGARIRMEQYYQDARTYLPSVAVAYPANTCTPAPAATANFTYTCTPTTATTYILTANGKAAKGMVNFKFTVDESGVQTSKFDGTVGPSCWLTGKGGTCN